MKIQEILKNNQKCILDIEAFYEKIKTSLYETEDALIRQSKIHEQEINQKNKEIAVKDKLLEELRRDIR